MLKSSERTCCLSRSPTEGRCVSWDTYGERLTKKMSKNPIVSARFRESDEKSNVISREKANRKGFSPQSSNVYIWT